MSLPTIDAPALFTYKELEKPENYQLDANCRCDACGAQAYNRATFKNDLELFFCRRHGRIHYSSILPHLKEWYTENVRIDGENRLIGSAN